MRTLWETFLNAYETSTDLPWRIYGRNSHKLLCADYGRLKNNDSLDDLKVAKATKKEKFWRIVVDD